MVHVEFTHQRRHLSILAGLLLTAVVVMPACSDSANDVADTKLAPTTTEATTTTIAVTTTTADSPMTSTTATTATTQPTTTTTVEPSAGPLDNGDFESGDLTAWSTQSWGGGAWLVYSDGSTPPDPSITDQHDAFEVPDPPGGDFAAVTDTNTVGLRFLYRDIVVTGSPMLHAVVFYENHGLEIHDPPTFGTINGEVWYYTGSIGSSGNQQYRVDLVDPQAPIESLEADDVLATVFRTVSGDPTALDPTPVSIDLSPWEGQTIRLRAAQVDNLGAMRAGIDDVRLEWNG